MAWHTRDGDEIWLDLEKYNLEETANLLKLCKDGCEAELDEFEDLLKNGADPNSHYQNAWTPLTRASHCGKEELVELLLRYHADVNVADQFGQTALHMACNKGNVEIVKTLIRGGATTYLNNELGRTPLDEARQNDHIEVVKYFEERDSLSSVTEDSSTDDDDKGELPKTGKESRSEASGDGTPGDDLSRKDQNTSSPADTEQSMPHCNTGLRGHMQRWKDYPELHVRFLNEIPHHWTVGNGERISKEIVLTWANIWRLKGGGLIPRFLEAKPGTEGQIRVEFNNNGRNTCVLGMKALSMPITKLSMWLDLSRGEDDYKKFLVIHIFGHVLGLQHEHQSTNFWSCIRPFIDIPKMKKDLLVSDKNFAKDWGENVDFNKPDYDPDSIMHFWFKKDWLVPRYRIKDEIEKARDSKELTAKQAQALLGVHKRHGNLVDEPSQQELKLLRDLYGADTDDKPKLAQTVPLGHILTKVELQVLSGLLGAYSNEKIKEIHLSVQRKQGGDISREEIEKSLREGGQNILADELERRLRNGVEKAEHYKVYEAALEGAKKVTLRYLRFLFIGIPRSGKSTMRRRMLQEIVNLSSLGQPSVSTGVADTCRVIVKELTTEAIAMAGSNWKSLKSSKGDLDHLIHLMYSLVTRPSADVAQKVDPTQSDEEHSRAVTTIIPGEETNTATTVQGHVNVADTDKEQEATNTREVADTPDPYQKENDDAFEALLKVVQSDSPEDFNKLLKSLTLIDMTDVGGQPEFLDMLPALTISTALYLLFFRLDRDLQEHYPVTFLAPGDSKEEPLETSYCMQEVIHQTLASIACFSGQVSEEDAMTASSRVMLVGTYMDKIKDDKDKQKEIEKEIREKFVKGKKYNDLLLTTQESKLFFAVDNMNGTQSEISKICDNIQNIIKKYFAEVPIPVSWLMFRIVLQLLNKSVVKVDQCEKIADRLSMTTPVREALWFFHHNVGSLLFYPDIPSVKDVVICKPQVVFDSLTTVITDNFKPGKYRASPDRCDKFKETGLFSLSEISKITQDHVSTHLSPKQLVDVLEHNGILAVVKCKDGKAASSESVKPEFIIPAVLKMATEEELMPSTTLEASPLIICFERGFLPFGVFSASIARLIARKEINHNSLPLEWSLDQDEVKKNKVKFLVAEAFVATLISRPQYLEIQVEQQPGAANHHELKLSEICFAVQQTVVQTLENTVFSMKYQPQQRFAEKIVSGQRPFNLAFKCSMPSHGDHFMKVVKDETSQRTMGKCLKKHFKVTLAEDHHRVWFNKAEMSVTSGVSAASSAVGSVEMFEHGPTSLDDKVQLFKMFRQGVERSLLKNFNNAEACKEHNTELFRKCIKTLRYDCITKSSDSQGELLERHDLGEAGHYKESGELTVTDEERKIEQITSTFTTTTEGGFTPKYLSLKQGFQASVSTMTGVNRAQLLATKLKFTIDEDKEADVKPVLEVFDAETKLIGLSVTLAGGSKLYYHTRGEACNFLTRKHMDIKQDEAIEISGTYKYIHVRKRPFITYTTKSS